MKKVFGLLVLALVILLSSSAFAYQYVRGYYRSNGAYVSPYFRSDADGYSYNNWSTYGNVNPFTGAYGTKPYYPRFNYSPRTTYVPQYYNNDSDD